MIPCRLEPTFNIHAHTLCFSSYLTDIPDSLLRGFVYKYKWLFVTSITCMILILWKIWQKTWNLKFQNKNCSYLINFDILYFERYSTESLWLTVTSQIMSINSIFYAQEELICNCMKCNNCMQRLEQLKLCF